MKLSGVFLSTFKLVGDALAKTVNESAPAIRKDVSIRREVVMQKFNDANTFYKQLVGLDRLEKYQMDVTEHQERLIEAQEKRRQIGLELAEIRKKSNDLQDQIHKMKRQQNPQRFLDAMREETELLKAEVQTSASFADQDRIEREIFTALSNSIGKSYEYQQRRLEETKYVGLAFGIVGSILGYFLTALKTEDMKKVVRTEMSNNNDSVYRSLSSLAEKLDDLNALVVKREGAAKSRTNATTSWRDQYLKNVSVEPFLNRSLFTNEISRLENVRDEMPEAAVENVSVDERSDKRVEVIKRLFWYSVFTVFVVKLVGNLSP